MAYERIDWENEPSVDTPLNEDNLNHMDEGIANLDSDVAGKMDADNPTGTGSLQVGTGNMKTDGNPSYALGFNAQAEGDNSFAFGSSTRAKKQGAYAIGIHAEARELYSMALGEEVIAASIHQTARGKYNEIDTDGVYLDIVGGGNPLERKNVETLTPNGDKWVAGDYTNGNGETLHGAYQAFIDGLPVDSESGNPCVITDAFDTNAKSLKLTLEPIQSGSGTPSPQNVRPISGRTQSVVTRTGKNLVSQINVGAWLGTTGNFNTSYLQFSGSEKIKVNPGETYTLSCAASSFSGPAHALLYYGKNKEYLGQALVVDFSSFPKTFIVPDNAYYCTFDVNAQKSNITSIQLESGSAATPYEPYNDTDYTIQLGQTVYGGVLDVTSGVLTITHALKTYTGASAENWIMSDGGKRCWIEVNGIKENLDPSYLPSIFCNEFETITANETYTGTQGISIASNRIYVSDGTGTMTAATFKTFLSSNNMVVAYPLATPTTVQLTAEEVTLLHGDNVLTTDADSIEASYSADIVLYIAKKIAEGISQGNRSLSKGGSSEPEEVKETKEEIKEEEVKEEK